MKLLALLFVLVLFTASSQAQMANSYIEPEYKIRLRDTTGTFIKIINYFDRTVYKKDIFLKRTLGNGSANYIEVEIDPNSGIGVIPKSVDTPVHVQIGKTLEIKNVTFKKNQVNKIEIRSEEGFLSMPYKWGRAQAKGIKGTLQHAYDSTISNVVLPAKVKRNKGKYYLQLNTIPAIRKTIYLKPSTIFYSSVHRAIPIQIMNAKNFERYKLFYSKYPEKKWKLCNEGTFNENNNEAVFHLDLQPKKLYQIQYRKKGKKRYKKKDFYLDTSMDVFNLMLD